MSEVVISGISGRFPESGDVTQLWENLVEGVDMVTNDERRWRSGLMGLPLRNGKLLELDKFDASFFEVHHKQANSMDPMIRILLEVTNEAIINAGLNPSKLAGTRTGVWIGASGSETNEAMTSDPQNMEGYVITGCSLSMFANRISFFYDFKGPSMTIDTACSSSLMALHLAQQSIKNGDCDAAIVGGAQLVLKPQTSLQFNKLHMLSPDGACKAFDESANGYVRSEAVAAIYICKKEDARRVYCDVIHSKTSSDGKKDEGITYPAGAQQKKLLEETYNECGINPCDVLYVEAHGTGTAAGDPEEVGALDDVMCKERRKPLLIGSIKSNMGHSEPASGLCGVIKCCLAATKRQIPANLHIRNLKKSINALKEGRIQPVVKLMRLPNESFIMGVNSFGFGGSNVHVILRANHELPIQPRDDNQTICLLTSRTESGIKDEVKDPPTYAAAFLNGMSDVPILRHPYRGYVIDMGNDGAMTDEQDWKKVKIRREVWFVCSGMGSQWIGMGVDLLKIPTFSNSITNCTKALRDYAAGIDVAEMLIQADEEAYKDIINAFVALVAVQIGLIDILSSLEVHCDGIIGHSVGELACSYADGSLNLEQTIQAAYLRGKCVKQADLPRGKMAAVGLTWEECEDQCPPNVTPACHNAHDSVTITGDENEVVAFVASLKEREIFAREVDTGGIAFHSKHMEGIYPQFRAELEKIIPEPKQRSNKWRSTSSQRSMFKACDDTSSLILESSAEYHANNLRSPVYFYDEIKEVKEDAIVIEIAPHCLMASGVVIGLCEKQKDGLRTLLSAIGNLHCNGANLKVNNLFGHASPPLQSCDKFLSHVDWDHDQSWFVPSPYQFSSSGGKPTDALFKIDTSPNSDDRYLCDHVIDGRPILPATVLLRLAWQTFANYLEIPLDDISLQFDDVTIHDATFLSQKELQLHVQFNPSIQAFTVAHEERLLASGRVKQMEGEIPQVDNTTCKPGRKLSRKEIYRKLRLCGYQYGPEFKLLWDAGQDGKFGRIKFNGNYTTFMDAVLQFTLIKSRDNQIRLPTRIRQIRFRPFQPDQVDLPVDVTREGTRTLAGGHMEVTELHVTLTTQRNLSIRPNVKVKKFFPYFCQINDSDVTNYADVIFSCVKSHPEFSKISSLSVPEHYVVGNSNNKESSLKHRTPNLIQVLNDVTSNDSKFSQHIGENLFTEWPSNYCLWNEEIMTSTIGIAVSELMFDVKLGAYFEKQSNNERSKKENYEQRKFQIPFTDFMETAEKYLGSIPNCKYEYQNISPTKKISWGGALPSDGDCNLIIANDIFAAGVVRGRYIVQKFVENLCGGGSFVMLHHTCKGNVIQDVCDEIMKTCDSNYVTSSLTVEQVTSELKRKNFRLVSHKQQKDCGSNLLLFRLDRDYDVTKSVTVEVSLEKLDWVDQLKDALLTTDYDVILIGRENLNGVDEFASSLRREIGSNRVRSVSNCSLDAACALPDALNEVLERHLVANVYQNGKWGSFQHVTSTKPEQVASDRSFLLPVTIGDLTSLTWFSLPPSSKQEYKTVFAALNFRDVMLASGQLPPQAIPAQAEKYRTLLGLEFSGFDHVGRKIMGIVPGEGFSTHVIQDVQFTWQVPDQWTLAEAATVPVVYSTAYYALVVRGRLRPGESILVHCGAGGVGQAAITLALARGCTVYTTVSSDEKKQFLKRRFPQLDDESFAQSRDATFERDILNRTNGKGVDLVLNSLSGEKLLSSVRCLANHGRFLEIGKFDLVKNNKLGLSIFLKNISFHGILLDSLLGDVTEQWLQVRELVQKGIEKGEVKPLSHRIFQKNDVESAFRLMTQGIHIGKVIVDVTSKADHVTNRISFEPDLCYVITGGLGGFGMELCDWIVRRGAKKIIITSRSGLRTGYQEHYVTGWEGKGVSVSISNSDVSTPEGASALLDERTGGVFHLAMVMEDRMFEKQTKESFEKVFRPKCDGIINLDKYSRIKSPNLKYFVAFSSVASFNGTKGQSNYILANSVMEQLCRRRHNDQLPAVAIEWGAVGDVGIAAERFGDSPVAGTLPQPISSCLKSLDELLSLGQPVVACYVIHKKTTKRELQKNSSPVPAVARILGIPDLTKVDGDVKLGRLGADSLMTSEVKQLLARDYGIVKETYQIRDVTFAELKTYKLTSQQKFPDGRKFQRLRSSSSMEAKK